jgi:hypothetical protein
MRRSTQHLTIFFDNKLYESLAALIFSRKPYKKVYMRGAQLLFVLLEKFGESFFDVGNPSIGGNAGLKNTQLTQNHSIHFNFRNKLWEN